MRRLAVSLKMLKIYVSYIAVILLLIILSQRNKNMYWEKALFNSVESDFISESQNLETAQMPFHKGISRNVFRPWNAVQQWKGTESWRLQ